MEEFQIINDMPIPAQSRANCGPKRTHAFHSLEVGQCIMYGAGLTKRQKNAIQAFARVTKMRHDGKRRFTTRTLADGRFGVWRVE